VIAAKCGSDQNPRQRAAVGRTLSQVAKNGASKTLCIAIALMLEDTVQALETEGDLIAKLYYLLGRYRIPKDQFYEVEKEIGDI